MFSLLVSTAFAVPLTWKWEPETHHRYVVEVMTQTPYVMWLLEQEDNQVRVWRIALEITMDCGVERPLPKSKGWDIHCAVEDASFFASPVQQDEGRADLVVHQAQELLKKGAVEFRLLTDGRVSAVQLVGLEEEDPRTRSIVDSLERFVERGVSALDVQLPADDAPTWRRRTFLAAEMPVAMPPPLGQIVATQSLATASGVFQGIGTRAEGTLAYGFDLWKIAGVANTDFDTSMGAVVAAWVTVTSEPGNTEIGPNTIPFRLDAKARLLTSDEHPQLSRSAEW